MCTISREEAAWRREHTGEKGRGLLEKLKKLSVVVWHGKQKIPAARALVSIMRDARAPASGHSTHFKPQHWLLCHMGLY
jgi:hypothetical protein